MSEATYDIAVVGGGASAVLLVAALHRQRPRPARPVRVLLVERSHPFGRGVAYSTTDPAHRMNVPAARLSVHLKDPEHLLQWLADQGDTEVGPNSYIPRSRYGDYLAHVLLDASRADHLDLTVRRADVVRIDPGSPEPNGSDPQWQLTLAGDEPGEVQARTVVLATGPPPAPAPVPVDPALSDDPRVVLDPWTAAPTLGAGGPRRVVIVGTGLTMVDVALTWTRDPAVRVDAVSRQAWLPRRHPRYRLPALEAIDLPPSGPLTAGQVRRALVRHAAREPRGWAASVDLFKDHSSALWERLDAREQAKLLRRRSAAWGAHRHRMAPPVATKLDRLVAARRIRLHRGRIETVRPAADGGVEVVVHRPGGGQQVLAGDVAVICTGPTSDVARTTDPLLRHLLDTGTARVGPHRLGLAIDATGHLRDRADQPVPGLFALGPLRRGTVFEATAIPELCVQATELAHQLGRVAEAD